MFTIGAAPADPDVGAEAAEAATPSAAGIPTRICSPSASTRARFRPPRRAPGRAPPAASSASTTRDPRGSVAMPGRRTLPATSTTMLPLAGLVASAGDEGRRGTARNGAAAVASAEGVAETGGSTVESVPPPEQPPGGDRQRAGDQQREHRRCEPVSRTRPCRVGGSRSRVQPPTAAARPTGRCACRPGIPSCRRAGAPPPRVARRTRPVTRGSGSPPGPDGSRRARRSAAPTVAVPPRRPGCGRICVSA